MPRRPSKNVVVRYIEFPPDLVRRVNELAEANDRSFKEEVIHALERHLERPPHRRIDTPDLDSAVVDPPPEKAKRRKEEPQPPPAAVDPPPEKAKRQGKCSVFGNGDATYRRLVAARNIHEAATILNVTVGEIRRYGSNYNGSEAGAMVLAEPGRVFRQHMTRPGGKWIRQNDDGTWPKEDA